MTTDLEWRYEDNSNQIYAWKKQLQQQAARAFDPGLAAAGKPSGSAAVCANLKISQREGAPVPQRRQDPAFDYHQIRRA